MENSLKSLHHACINHAQYTCKITEQKHVIITSCLVHAVCMYKKHSKFEALQSSVTVFEKHKRYRCRFPLIKMCSYGLIKMFHEC